MTGSPFDRFNKWAGSKYIHGKTIGNIIGIFSQIWFPFYFILFLPDWYCVVPGQHGLSRRTWRRTRFWRSWSRRAQSSSRIVQRGPEHLKILMINLGFVSLLDYEGGLLDRILWKMVQQRSFCASKIIRLMFVIVFISFSIYCTNQIVGKNIRIVAQQWWTQCWFFSIYCDSHVKLG